MSPMRRAHLAFAVRLRQPDWRGAAIGGVK
jgi:hypothetical protein